MQSKTRKLLKVCGSGLLHEKKATDCAFSEVVIPTEKNENIYPW